MADDFWAPVFERLQEDYSFLALVAADTSDNDLISWVKPNRALFARCARFIKKNRIADKPALIREMLTYARSDNALRKIILFTWVEKNPQTMAFPSLVSDQENEAKLLSGVFGGPAKIRILAQIDPRPAAQPVYERVLASFAATEPVETVPTAAVAAEVSDQEDSCVKRLEARVAELERLLESFRADNRQLKKQSEQQHDEIVAQNRRIEDYSQKLKQAEQTKLALDHEVAGLRSRAAMAEEQLAKLPAVVESQPSSDFSQRLDSLSTEVEALRRALEHREATIRRLEAEKAGLVEQQSADSDRDRQIEFLRRRLAELEPLSQSGLRLAGQLVSTHKEPCGRRTWLFMSISGQVIFVEGSLVSRTSLVREEFSILQLDRENRPVALESLESDARREICGHIEVCGGDSFLVADLQRYKVMVEIPESHVGVPVRGIWLPEFAERQAGVYRVELLAQHEHSANIQKAADLKRLRAFFGVSQLNPDRFVELLKQRGVDYQKTADGELTFSADYHEVLAPLRLHVKIYRSCDNVSCRSLAAGEALVRVAGPGQSCDFCGRVLPAEVLSAVPLFSGQRVKIFGGDYVGSEYERALAQNNLKVEWHSGFKTLSELKTGLGRPDLVVVIVRQISHTLLRELVSAVARDSLPVLYSSRRGISGVLSELTRYFGVKRA